MKSSPVSQMIFASRSEAISGEVGRDVQRLAGVRRVRAARRDDARALVDEQPSVASPMPPSSR